ncbi:hypothetical protein [Leptospira sp. GIMC2001]|uniref:hypothetical protein n=1 Tax=Leptospira sp. GIMC2001 TaxID=1513297 RepID=UPI002349DF60|nr:hypothetical protein [Leptospira sp. GIMC2001]WCL51014.1 hypothetical protein O4O04_09440 [Leptospira sp. GIMC2001]
MKKRITETILLAALLVTCQQNVKKQIETQSNPVKDGFNFILENPNTIINIPEIQQFGLTRHPLAESKPHLRYMGNAGNVNLSISTPTSDNGMDAEECASAIFGSIISRYKLEKGKFSAIKGIDNNTFGIFFANKISDVFQLNAYLVSSDKKTHCIEIHISKITLNERDILDWMKGMPGARITLK